MEAKSFGQELLLHEYRLLEFDQLHLHELQFGDLVIQRTLGRRVELEGCNDRLGGIDV
jgi:hypothetical protein